MERLVLVDDFDGTIAEGVQKHPLTLGDEVIGSVDLTDANRQLLREELRRAMDRFVAKARPRTQQEAAEARVAAKLTPSSASEVSTTSKVGGKSHLSKKQRAEREQLNAIRQWARRNHYEVSPYGKIPEKVLQAFHSDSGIAARRATLKAVTKATDAVTTERPFSHATA